MCVCVLHNVTGVFCLKQAFVFTIYISWNEVNYTVDSTSGKLENDILFNLRQSGAYTGQEPWNLLLDVHSTILLFTIFVQKYVLIFFNDMDVKF